MIIYAPPTAGKSWLKPDVDTDDVILDYLKDKFKIPEPTHKDWMPLSNHKTRLEVFELAKKKLNNRNAVLVTNFTDVPVDIAFRFESDAPLAVRWYSLGRHDFFNWLLTPAKDMFNLQAKTQIYLGDGCFVGDVDYLTLKDGTYHTRKYNNIVFLFGKECQVYRLVNGSPVLLRPTEYQASLAKRDNYAEKERDIEDSIFNLHATADFTLLDSYLSVKQQRAIASLQTAALFLTAPKNCKEEYILRFASSPEGKRKANTTGIRGLAETSVEDLND